MGSDGLSFIRRIRAAENLFPLTVMLAIKQHAKDRSFLPRIWLLTHFFRVDRSASEVLPSEGTPGVDTLDLVAMSIKMKILLRQMSSDRNITGAIPKKNLHLHCQVV